MAIQKIAITQVMRLERRIVIEREADTVEEAINDQECDDAPDYGDARWVVVSNEIHNEEVEAA